jgi:cytochrome c-type biogenesis protein CcmH/NrfF
MAPPKVGFNILGYIMPGIALGIGAIVLAIVIRRWRRPAAHTASPAQSAQADATPEEIAQIEAAIRDES